MCECVDWIQLAHFPVTVFYELGNEILSSKKGGKYLDWLIDF
jgi:hypothetical protein